MLHEWKMLQTLAVSTCAGFVQLRRMDEGVRSLLPGVHGHTTSTAVSDIQDVVRGVGSPSVLIMLRIGSAENVHADAAKAKHATRELLEDELREERRDIWPERPARLATHCHVALMPLDMAIPQLRKR